MPSGDGGGMPDMGSFFGGQSDTEDRMNQENITLSEDDVDDIETFASGISARPFPTPQNPVWMAEISMKPIPIPSQE